MMNVMKMMIMMRNKYLLLKYIKHVKKYDTKLKFLLNRKIMMHIMKIITWKSKLIQMGFTFKQTIVFVSGEMLMGSVFEDEDYLLLTSKQDLFKS